MSSVSGRAVDASGTTGKRSLRRACVSLVCLLLSLLLVTAPTAAHADPLDTGGLGDLALPWGAFGLPDEITLVGADINQDFTLPVPTGMSATRLRGLLHAPVDFGAGFLQIEDAAGRLLATVDLPAVTRDQAVVPFDVDISAAQVRDSAIGLSFTVRQAPVPPDQRCGLGERLQISDLATVLVGAEAAPTSVATFFPPLLQRLTVYTPVDADGAEQQAVLALTSAVARMYRPQPTAITVVNHPRGAAPPPAPQLARAVVIENGDAGLTVVNPDRADVHLKVTGRGDQLTDQVSLVVDELQSLVQVPTARVEQASSAGRPDTDEMTFAQLNLAGESTVLRTSNLTVGVDRSALGAGRVDGLKVHLLATHTPVADEDSASVMVSVGQQAVFTAPLGESGRVDAVFDVPGELLGQRVVLGFDLTFSPRQLCSPLIAPMTFELDPASTLTMQRGGPAPGGFGAVPSEFSPELLVALDGSGPDQLDYAARVLADIARLTDAEVMPRVVDVKAAADATTGALIVANSSTLETTALRPLVGGESSEVRIGLRDELRAAIDNGLGSIQVFADQPRDRTVVLVTTSGAWTLVEPLLSYIDQLPDGWSTLDGDVLAAGEQGTVTTLAIGSDEPPPTPAADGVAGTVWLVIGAGALVLLLLGIAAVVRWRGHRVPRA